MHFTLSNHTWVKNQHSVTRCKIQTSSGEKSSEINIAMSTCICYMVLLTEKYVNNLNKYDVYDKFIVTMLDDTS